MVREVRNYSACAYRSGDLYANDRVEFVPLTFANVRFAISLSAAPAFCCISVRDYSRNCANLSPFVTLVDAVESNDTYKRRVMILINPLALVINAPLIDQCE